MTYLGVREAVDSRYSESCHEGDFKAYSNNSNNKATAQFVNHDRKSVDGMAYPLAQ